MQDFQVTPTITTGTILLALTFVGTFIGTAMVLYWKLKTKWFDLQRAYIQHTKEVAEKQTTEIQAALNEQTKRIETCIHAIPGHPENQVHGQENSLNNQIGTSQNTD